MIHPYNERKEAAEKFLQEELQRQGKAPGLVQLDFAPIQDPVPERGGSDPSLDCIVVSEETVGGAAAINRMRATNQIAPLHVVVASTVPAPSTAALPLAPATNSPAADVSKLSSSLLREQCLGTFLPLPSKQKRQQRQRRQHKGRLQAGPYLVGLTGGIASGKSTVARLLCALASSSSSPAPAPAPAAPDVAASPKAGGDSVREEKQSEEGGPGLGRQSEEGGAGQGRQWRVGAVDCDRLAHRAYEPGTPAYRRIVDLFRPSVVRPAGGSCVQVRGGCGQQVGVWGQRRMAVEGGGGGLRSVVWAGYGQIDRAALGAQVFSCPEKMAALTGVVWPMVRQIVEEEREAAGAGEWEVIFASTEIPSASAESNEKASTLLESTEKASAFETFKNEYTIRPIAPPADVLIVEAAMMVEAGSDRTVDEVWVVFVPEAEAKARLMARNGVTEEEAGKRIAAQVGPVDGVGGSPFLLLVALFSSWLPFSSCLPPPSSSKSLFLNSSLNLPPSLLFLFTPHSHLPPPQMTSSARLAHADVAIYNGATEDATQRQLERAWCEMATQRAGPFLEQWRENFHRLQGQWQIPAGISEFRVPHSMAARTQPHFLEAVQSVWTRWAALMWRLNVDADVAERWFHKLVLVENGVRREEEGEKVREEEDWQQVGVAGGWVAAAILSFQHLRSQIHRVERPDSLKLALFVALHAASLPNLPSPPHPPSTTQPPTSNDPPPGAPPLRPDSPGVLAAAREALHSASPGGDAAAVEPQRASADCAASPGGDASGGGGERHLFCFGLGYVAVALSNVLLSKGWYVVVLLLEAVIRGSGAVECASIERLASLSALRSATHVLVSIPPFLSPRPSSPQHVDMVSPPQELVFASPPPPHRRHTHHISIPSLSPLSSPPTPQRADLVGAFLLLRAPDAICQASAEVDRIPVFHRRLCSPPRPLAPKAVARYAAEREWLAFQAQLGEALADAPMQNEALADALVRSGESRCHPEPSKREDSAVAVVRVFRLGGIYGPFRSALDTAAAEMGAGDVPSPHWTTNPNSTSSRRGESSNGEDSSVTSQVLSGNGDSRSTQSSSSSSSSSSNGGESSSKGNVSSTNRERRQRKRFTSRCHVADICAAIGASMDGRGSSAIINIVDDDPSPRRHVMQFARQLIASGESNLYWQKLEALRTTLPPGINRRGPNKAA
ncbi:unnamed protein product [Closterium sp. Naga37s-1]|nr:unnamed protein product [Closterium sp. Naga37s-1]